MAPREYSMEKMNYQLGHCDVQDIWIGYSVNQQCVDVGIYNVGSVQKSAIRLGTNISEFCISK